MVDLNAALLGPCDLPGREFTLGSAHVERKVKKDKNGQERVFFRVTPSYSAKDSPSCIHNRQPNLGLLFQRYAPQLVPDSLLATDVPEAEKAKLNEDIQDFSKQFHNTVGLEWTIQFANKVPTSSHLKEARSLWRKTLRQTYPSVSFVRATLSKRAAIGLANASPWENSGWAFHHVYGVPMIPGDSLKGLMRHYLEEELRDSKGEALLNGLGFSGGDAAKYLAALSLFVPGQFSAQDLANLLFGKPGSDGAEGLLAVYDAWPEAPDKDGWFALDVVTSHHRDYYTSGYGENSKASDKDQPNPVHFLTLRPGLNFHIALAPTAVAERQAALLRKNAEASDETPEAAAKKPSVFIQAIVEVGKALCLKALAEWGVGAKTGTGYGRMHKVEAPSK